MGASMGDIDDASRPLRDVSGRRDDLAAETFFEAWTTLGEKVKRLAAVDEARGRHYSASEKYRRAAIYFVQAERMQAPGYEPRELAYANYLECFSRFVLLAGENCCRVEIPYGDRKSTRLNSSHYCATRMPP